MTKLEELARSFRDTCFGTESDDNAQAHAMRLLEAALKPLLDAAYDAGEILMNEGYPETAKRLKPDLPGYAKRKTSDRRKAGKL